MSSSNIQRHAGAYAIASQIYELAEACGREVVSIIGDDRSPFVELNFASAPNGVPNKLVVGKKTNVASVAKQYGLKAAPAPR